MELLLDPLRDRFVETLAPPPPRALDRIKLFPKGIKYPPDWIMLRNHLEVEGKIAKKDCLLLIKQVIELFKREQNILELNDPITIAGNITGQYYDLLQILERGRDPNQMKYLFLGNHVGRSYFNIEVTLLLYALKLNFPQTFFMTRGNHECRGMTSFFNFQKETLYKYDIETYDAFMESFDALPLACIINNHYIAIHGGISPELSTLKDISNLNRFQEPSRKGLFADILWSDPIDNVTGECPKKYIPNTNRGCSVLYSVKAVNKFLKKNRLVSIIRSHECQASGYKMHRWNGPGKFPCVITIFSASNYCDVYANQGAFLEIENDKFHFEQYNWREHPYVFPNFMGLFEWSIPFVIEKVLAVVQAATKPPNKAEAEREFNVEELVKKLKEDVRKAKLEIIKNKVRKIIRISKAYRGIKEIMIQLKGVWSNNKMLKWLQELRKAIIGAVINFTTPKMDCNNEKISN